MDERVQERLRELKERYPESFTQEGIGKDEICLGIYVVDVVDFDLASIRRQGISSARHGSKGVTRSIKAIEGYTGTQKEVTLQVLCFPIFANAEEVILAEFKAGSSVAK